MKIKNISLFALIFVLSSKAAFAGYGYSPITHEAPVCKNSVPGRPNISYVLALGNGEIKVGWDQVNSATSWTVAYGRNSNQYTYGIVNFGDNQSRAVNISMLPEGTYYIALKANNGCMPGSFSPEQKIVVGANGKVSTSAVKKTVVQRIRTIVAPKTTPTTTPTVEPTVTSAPVQIESPTPTPEKVGYFKRLFNAILNK